MMPRKVYVNTECLYEVWNEYCDDITNECDE